MAQILAFLFVVFSLVFSRFFLVFFLFLGFVSFAAPTPGPTDARSVPDKAAGSPAEAAVGSDNAARGAASVSDAAGARLWW